MNIVHALFPVTLRTPIVRFSSKWSEKKSKKMSHHLTSERLVRGCPHFDNGFHLIVILVLRRRAGRTFRGAGQGARSGGALVAAARNGRAGASTRLGRQEIGVGGRFHILAATFVLRKRQKKIHCDNLYLY